MPTYMYMHAMAVYPYSQRGRVFKPQTKEVIKHFQGEKVRLEIKAG